jgi:peptidoglycan LD-endopeptidase CwlK
MSELIDTWKRIQHHLVLEEDGVAGLVTARAVAHALGLIDPNGPGLHPPFTSADSQFDARTEKVLATLDPKAIPRFRKFLCLAKATAATFGCDYIAISGNRTYAEQDALYAKGRTKPGKEVTKARGGYSNHNFAIAADFGVFNDGRYLDDGSPPDRLLASRVHKACSMHAEACGLEWGGNWKSIVDQPHFEVSTGLTLGQKRQLLKEKGSVL